ncbi:MAG: ROK family protein [Candidatus Peregrinibacteria bacterium]
MPSLLGIDLGGTKIAIARYDAETFERQDFVREDTRAHERGDAVFARMLELAVNMRAADTTAVGIGVPGFVQRPEGIIRTLPNIPGAEGKPLKEIAGKALSLPVTVDNDASCFTLAEALCGTGKGHAIVVGITMGTGVGGGIVMDGRLFHGAHGFAAEIGHMLLQPGHPPYPTEDQRGDVEQFISGTAMGRRCSAAKRPEDYLVGDVCAFLQPEVVREVAELCASITHLLDPSVIVFGGSAGRALKPHLKEIEQELSQWVYKGTPLPALAIGSVSDAGTVGAALLTQESEQRSAMSDQPSHCRGL